MKSFREIIDLWPSRKALCADIGVTPGGLNQMLNRNKVASKYWTSMILGAQERGIEGVTLTALAQADSATAKNRKESRVAA